MSVLQVQTNEEQQRFDKIWIPAFLEQGYEIESYILPQNRDVIFYDDDGDFGTLELVPWKAVPEWPINQTFPFHKFPQLHNKRVVECDKLAIVKEKRAMLVIYSKYYHICSSKAALMYIQIMAFH